MDVDALGIKWPKVPTYMVLTYFPRITGPPGLLNVDKSVGRETIPTWANTHWNILNEASFRNSAFKMVPLLSSADWDIFKVNVKFEMLIVRMLSAFELSGPDICCPMFINTGSGNIDVFEVYLSSEMLIVRGHQHVLSTHERMCNWMCKISGSSKVYYISDIEHAGYCCNYHQLTYPDIT